MEFPHAGIYDVDIKNRQQASPGCLLMCLQVSDIDIIRLSNFDVFETSLVCEDFYKFGMQFAIVFHIVCALFVELFAVGVARRIFISESIRLHFWYVHISPNELAKNKILLKYKTYHCFNQDKHTDIFNNISLDGKIVFSFVTICFRIPIYLLVLTYIFILPHFYTYIHTFLHTHICTEKLQ